MPEPALFIGVVSHLGSRFAVSQGPDGLAARLALELESGQGSAPMRVQMQVNTANLLDEAVLPVSPELVQASLTAELALDRQWARYLGRSMGAGWWATYALRWGRRAERAVRPPDLDTIRRLLNIELSHLELMRTGVESGAPWVLVLEDDAMSPDVVDLADGVRGLMACEDPAGFVNLSRSFRTADLGIEHLLSPSGQDWAGTVSRAVLASDRPVTNTVCAILYRSTFLAELVSAIDALPMTPVVPIDWKVNQALMDMFAVGQVARGACWLVEPAPITQMSMQPAGILPA